MSGNIGGGLHSRTVLQYLHVPVFHSRRHFLIVETFLKHLATNCPDVVQSLFSFKDLYTSAVDKFISNRISSIENSRWAVITATAVTAECFGLREALISWGLEWRLFDLESPRPFYLEIGLRALADHVSHNRVDSDEEFLVSLTSTLHYVGEETFTSPFPFVFAPPIMPEMSIVGHDEEIEPFEELWAREQSRFSLQLAQKFGHTEKSFIELNPNFKVFNDIWLGCSWDPSTPWKTFETKINDLFTQYKAAYKKRMEQFLESWDIEKIDIPWEREHFDWLICFQIRHKKWLEIANEYHVSKTEVRNKIKALAKELCIELRHADGKQGRPIGSRDSYKRRRTT